MNWLRRRADDVAVLLLSAMFVAFIVQIVSRYVFNHPLGWTLEACVTLWLWTVLWGSAFCLSHHDHVRFDMLYGAVRTPLRRVFAGIAAVIIVIAFAAALPATWGFVSFLTIKKSATLRIPLAWGFVSFLTIKKSATLRIPLAWVFSIYLVFMVATIAAFGWRLWRVLKGDPDAEPAHPVVTP